MNEYFNKNHPWQKRGISINPKFIQNYVVLPMLIIMLVITFGAISCYIGKGVIEVRNDHIIKIKIEEQKKIDREKAIEAQKQKTEHEEQIKRQQEEKNKKNIGDIIYNKNVALWNYIKKEYPKGTYVLKKATMQKGRIIDYQGERILTDCDWYFDYGEDIEIIGYKEYRQYVKLMEKIK